MTARTLPRSRPSPQFAGGLPVGKGHQGPFLEHPRQGRRDRGKPVLREPFHRRRCLVPVDNFYEWAKTATGKQPYAIALADRGLMALAGLWETWRSPAGEWVRSFAIITTTPNELCAELHNRMPVVLSPDVWVGVVGRGTSRPSTSKGPARSLPRGGDGLLARKYPGRKREEQRCEPDRARCSQPVMQSQTVHE
jgi:hypothetical protein